MSLNLKALLVPSKETTIEFPGMPGFALELSFLSRESLQKIRKQATKTVYKNRQPIEELDDDVFLELYVKSTIRGWKGLQLKYLQELAPIKIGDADPSAELPYTEEDALGLMRSSVNFDNFISETATSLGNFTDSK